MARCVCVSLSLFVLAQGFCPCRLAVRYSCPKLNITEQIQSTLAVFLQTLPGNFLNKGEAKCYCVNNTHWSKHTHSPGAAAWISFNFRFTGGGVTVYVYACIYSRKSDTRLLKHTAHCGWSTKLTHGQAPSRKVHYHAQLLACVSVRVCACAFLYL